MKCEKSKMIL